MLKEMQVIVQKVIIHRLVNGVFFASIYAIDADGKSMVFDSRPSDAEALAVRVECPIFALSTLLEQAGITPQEESEADGTAQEIQEEVEPVVSKETREELEALLDEAVENEDYELAARLRDKLDKLK
jgi:bifunctional DNase/RNase